MSTRAQVNFCERGYIYARIYIHGDGYPDGRHGMLARFEEFFADAAKNCTKNGPRFNDASYLAAKFVVWQADRNAVNYSVQVKPGKFAKTHRLDFLGVGILSIDCEGAEYVYTIECNGERKPAVTYTPDDEPQEDT